MRIQKIPPLIPVLSAALLFLLSLFVPAMDLNGEGALHPGGAMLIKSALGLFVTEPGDHEPGAWEACAVGFFANFLFLASILLIWFRQLTRGNKWRLSLPAMIGSFGVVPLMLLTIPLLMIKSANPGQNYTMKLAGVYPGYFMWLVAGISLVLGAWLYYQVDIGNRYSICSCGYSLRALTSSRCPECGRDVPVKPPANKD